MENRHYFGRGISPFRSVLKNCACIGRGSYEGFAGQTVCHPELVSGSHCRDINPDLRCKHFRHSEPKATESSYWINHRLDCFARPAGSVNGTRNDNRKIAFTLAEVLITLGIIGVVAALTMPTLMANYQKKQTVTQLKKAYSELSQAVRMAESTQGPIDSWNFVSIEDPLERAAYFSKNYLFPNLKILKSSIPSSSDCWVEEVYNLDGDVYTYLSNGNRACFSTSSGYSVYYWLHSTGNGGWFWVDINGSKKPNTIGKDIFPLMLGCGDSETVNPDISNIASKLGLYPYGIHIKNVPMSREDFIEPNLSDIQQFACKKGSGLQAGSLCAGLIQYDGWEIAPDYPW